MGDPDQYAREGERDSTRALREQLAQELAERQRMAAEIAQLKAAAAAAAEAARNK